MACLSENRNSNGDIISFSLVYRRNGKREKIVLPEREFPRRRAEDAKRLLEDVLIELGGEGDISSKLAKKINDAPNFKKRLIDKGIIEDDEETTLGELWNKYELSVEFKELSASAQTAKIGAKTLSLMFFGSDAIVDSFTKNDANSFKEWLKSNGNLAKPGAPIAEATRAGRIRDLKSLINWGIENELIEPNNPVLTISRGSMINRSRLGYISTEDARKMLDACNSRQWRLLIALARFGGLRIPSEVALMVWDDFDFESGMLTIRDQKRDTERKIPLFPTIREEAQALRQERGKTKRHDRVIIGKTAESNLRTTLIKIRERAGVPDYGKPWQNLRASAATDIARKYGAFLESQWVGHSVKISNEHYQQTISDDLRKATVDEDF